MRFAAVAEKEEDLVKTTAMLCGDGVFGGGIQAHLGDELVD